MVRIEKCLWEQLANTKMLNRERVLTRPQKWFNESRVDQYSVASNLVFNNGISGFILRGLDSILAKFIYRWKLDIAHQRGLNLEDSLVFTDRELRRCYFFETIARQNLHPYTVLFMKKRRARYYKVERALRGFYVPDWVRKEAEQREMAGTVDNILTWENFVYKEYMSDMTPIGRWSHLSKLIPLDMFQYYGIFRNDAWNRYFYNEAFYEGYTDKQRADASNPFGRFNLGTASGKADFEKEINTFIERYPFAINQPGQKFDFNRFYALEAMSSKRDISKLEPALLESIKAELEEQARVPKDDGTNKTRKLKARLPDWVLPKPGQAFQA